MRIRKLSNRGEKFNDVKYWLDSEELMLFDGHIGETMMMWGCVKEQINAEYGALSNFNGLVRIFKDAEGEY